MFGELINNNNNNNNNNNTYIHVYTCSLHGIKWVQFFFLFFLALLKLLGKKYSKNQNIGNMEYKYIVGRFCMK
jgi:hypothetical protein